MDSSHPSFLELDRLSLDPVTGTQATRDHVAACEQCQSHLKRLEAPVPVPAWLREPRKASSWWGWGRMVALGAVAATAGVIAIHRAAVPTLPPAILIDKGAGPGLSLYVKHGDEVKLWDGVQPVHQGDSLRLEVASDGAAHLQVTTPDRSGSRILYEGDLTSKAPTFLPVSWRVDDSPGAEVLDITVTVPGAPPWHTRFTLTKLPGSGS